MCIRDSLGDVNAFPAVGNIVGGSHIGVGIGRECVGDQRVAKGTGWFMTKDLEIDEGAIKKVSADETQFSGWWKLFVRTIEIKERRNPRCQMNMMPKRYWHNMNELN